jgi:hypothetical protein
MNDDDFIEAFIVCASILTWSVLIALSIAITYLCPIGVLVVLGTIGVVLGPPAVYTWWRRRKEMKWH